FLEHEGRREREQRDRERVLDDVREALRQFVAAPRADDERDDGDDEPEREQERRVRGDLLRELRIEAPVAQRGPGDRVGREQQGRREQAAADVAVGRGAAQRDGNDEEDEAGDQKAPPSARLWYRKSPGS